ncbi:hypothetical protein L208DRAFT_1381787 [Tricholoma matsutake]|nr:hypothetical protein L208DRAFT_1381787 [Tricholoma matsutake 945]
MSTSDESNTASTITPTATPATALSNAPSNLGGPMPPAIPVTVWIGDSSGFLGTTEAIPHCNSMAPVMPINSISSAHCGLNLAAMTTASNPLVPIKNSLETAQPAKKSRAAPAAVVGMGMTEKYDSIPHILETDCFGSGILP